MTAKGHAFLTTAIVFPIASLTSTPLPTDFLIGIIIGSWLPDIDEPGSYLGRRLQLISLILKKLGVQHRTITHSILFALVVALPALFYPPLKLLFIGFALGVILHCIGDLLTKSGLTYFFYPIKKEIHLLPKKLRFRTGSKVEYFIIVILAIITIYFSQRVHYVPGGFEKIDWKGIQESLGGILKYVFSNLNFK